MMSALEDAYRKSLFNDIMSFKRDIDKQTCNESVEFGLSNVFDSETRTEKKKK